MTSIRLIAAMFLTQLVQNCSAPEEISSIKGYVGSQDDRWPSRTIPVCFEQEGFQTLKENITLRVTSEYERAGFLLTGWNTCLEDSPGIRIEFTKDGYSQAEGFGKGIDGVKKGIKLGFLTDDEEIGISHSCSTNCQANTALHEFGHALGLHHEMNRPDREDCASEDQMKGKGEPDAVQVGDYDSGSIMSYCRLDQADENDQLLSLSEDDIGVLQDRYNTPTITTITGISHKKTSSLSTEVTFNGIDTTQYKFKISKKFDDNCDDLQGYSEARPIKQSIPSSVIASLPKRRLLKLCVIGGNDDHIWQSPKYYSSKVFFLDDDQDNSVPLLTETRWRFDLSDNHFIYADLYFKEQSDLIELGTAIRAINDPELFIFSYDALPVPVDPEKGIYRVRFKKKNILPGTKIYIYEIIMNDLSNNGGRFYANIASRLYEFTETPVNFAVID